MNEAVCTSGEHRSLYLLEVDPCKGFGIQGQAPGVRSYARLFTHRPHDSRPFFHYLTISRANNVKQRLILD